MVVSLAMSLVDCQLILGRESVVVLFGLLAVQEAAGDISAWALVEAGPPHQAPVLGRFVVLGKHVVYEGQKCTVDDNIN